MHSKHWHTQYKIKLQKPANPPTVSWVIKTACFSPIAFIVSHLWSSFLVTKSYLIENILVPSLLCVSNRIQSLALHSYSYTFFSLKTWAWEQQRIWEASCASLKQQLQCACPLQLLAARWLCLGGLRKLLLIIILVLATMPGTLGLLTLIGSLLVISHSWKGNAIRTISQSPFRNHLHHLLCQTMSSRSGWGPWGKLILILLFF